MRLSDEKIAAVCALWGDHQWLAMHVINRLVFSVHTRRSKSQRKDKDTR